MARQKYLVGADVGFATFGLSVFKLDEDSGFEFVGAISLETQKASKASKTRVDSDNIRRITELIMLIDKFLNHAVGDGAMFVAAEFPTAGTQSSKAAMAFGMGTGLFASYLACRDIPFEHVTPDDVKLVAVGRRQKVDKHEVEAGITRVMEQEGITFRGLTLSKYLDKFSPTKALRSHMADSVAAAWWAVTNSNNYKSFIA